MAIAVFDLPLHDSYSYHLYHLVDTAVTRANAHRAEAELANRHATNPPGGEGPTGAITTPGASRGYQLWPRAVTTSVCR